MSSAKFYIWGGEQWRELNTTSGEVAGWSRRPRFVFARRGRLRVAARRRVLAALQAHAANQPSALRLGPRLSVLSKEPESAPTVSGLKSIRPAQCGYHHCCVYYHGHRDKNTRTCNVNGEIILNDCFTRNAATKGSVVSKGLSLINGAYVANEPVATQSRCDASTQHRDTVDAAVQHTPRDHQPIMFNVAQVDLSRLKDIPQTDRCNPDVKKKTTSRTTAKVNLSQAPTLDKLMKQHKNAKKRHRSGTSCSDSEQKLEKPNKMRRSEDSENARPTAKETRSKTVRKTSRGKKKSRSESLSSVEPKEVCKELTISESDVLALRSYVARTRPDALHRFDADDAYKRLLFYAINPLVDVERCAHTERVLRERHATALPHFAARLGLAPRSSATDTDKENKHNVGKPGLRSNNRPRKAAVEIQDSTEESDDDYERSLLQYSRENKKSATLPKRNTIADRDGKPAQSVKFRNENRNDVRRNITEILDCKETGHAEFGSGKSDLTHKGPRLKTQAKSNRSSKNRSAFKKRKSRPVTNENKLASNIHKYESAPKPESKTEEDSAEEFKTLDKCERENRPSSNNKRRSFRHKPVIPRKQSSEDSETDEPLKKSESKERSDVSNTNKRESLRLRPTKLCSYTVHNSSSDDANGTNLQSEDTSRNRSSKVNKKTVSQHHSTTDDSDSDEEDSESNNKREYLSRKSKTDNRYTNSDYKLEPPNSSKENERRSTLPLTKHNHRSDSEEESDSFQKKAEKRSSENPSISGQNAKSSRSILSSADSENPGASKSVNQVKSSSRSGHSKTRQSPTSTGVNRVTAEAKSMTAVPTHTISKRASSSKLKEYSNLEDHAIVSWVSVGARARKVNGNALWRELQDQYSRITGVRRTWHSLRNRYLRYILPALGALCLPPADASRLRAAAATGSLKAKRAGEGARRNSIFDQSAVNAASSRVARPKPAGSDTPPHAPPDPQTDSSASVVSDGGLRSSARRSLHSSAANNGTAETDNAANDEGAGASGRQVRTTRLSAGRKSPTALAKRSRKLFNPKMVL